MGGCAVLEHLISLEFEPAVSDSPEEGFTPFDRATPTQVAEGQIQTSNWLQNIGAASDEEVASELERTQAAQAFAALTTDAPTAKRELALLTTPPAIQRLVGMLTTYEWNFVEEAQRLRQFTVAKILEETDHPDARIRLRALGMLGKVTEVGLFTERVEVTKDKLSDDELDGKIRERFAALQKTLDAELIERVERNKDATDVFLDDDDPLKVPDPAQDDDAATDQR